MRKDIINISNELAAGAGLDFHIIETYNAIFNYCKEHKKQPRKNKYYIKSGCLYINDKLITRVEPLPRKMCFDAAADYYENKILNRQETYTL